MKKVSYGDGSSRLWEGPLVVVMYSFVTLYRFDDECSVLIIQSCRVSSVGETQPTVDTVAVVDT